MRMLKELLLIFFAGLGIHRVLQDILYWIDPELVVTKTTGYFSIVAFIVVWFVVKYFKERDKASEGEPGTIS